jgi:hypothetical protein
MKTQLAWIPMLMLVACGGGSSSPASGPPSISAFTSDHTSYFVGDQAKLSATYNSGVGHIEPGGVPIPSGQTVTTAALSTNTIFHLVVTGNGSQATRDLAVTVSYRDRMRAIAMPFARAEHGAVALPDGRVLIIGGRDESTLVARLMYVFDPATETFTQSGSLGTAGPYGAATVALTSGDTLIVGGLLASVSTEAALIRSGNVVPTVGQPHTQRVWATTTRLEDGKVLLVGGLLATDVSGVIIGVSTTADRSAEIYDPATGLFTVLAESLSAGRYRHTATATTDGRVLIYGGITENGDPAPPELFTQATGLFSVLTAPEAGVRANHAAVKTSDGDIWIVGGEDPAGSTLSSVMRFDHTSGTLSHALDLATPRTSVSAALLTDSRLLIAGGVISRISGQNTESSELVTTAGSIAHPGPAMSSARHSNTMTALSNGKVLIVGGFDQDAKALATAEIYE